MWKVVFDTGKATRCNSKQAALEAAQSHCDRQDRSAEVFDRKGRLRFRYWWDSEGLQYLEY